MPLCRLLRFVNGGASWYRWDNQLALPTRMSPIFNTNESNEAPLSIAESPEQIPSPMAVLSPSLPNAGEDGLAIVNISTAETPDKRSSPSGVRAQVRA
jgi:hypothetical protein